MPDVTTQDIASYHAAYRIANKVKIAAGRITNKAKIAATQAAYRIANQAPIGRVIHIMGVLLSVSLRLIGLVPSGHATS